jgi:hypothetical protein
MTIEQRNIAITEVANYNDQDAFISDMALSSAFISSDPGVGPDVNLIEALRHIWIIVKAPFRVFLQELGLGQTACARRFCIPMRTVQGWALEQRQCPVYIRIMIAEILGY